MKGKFVHKRLDVFIEGTIFTDLEPISTSNVS